jgi:Fe-S-cluster containining protein
VPQGSRDFAPASKLGITLKAPANKELAVLIVPTSFIPSSFPCPALKADNLCGIHENKPSRCKTMPFYPYREERYQAGLLSPREGWACDTSADAPVVFENNKIISRGDFDTESQELREQVPMLRQYAQYMFKYGHAFEKRLLMASTQPQKATVISSLSSFLTATKCPDAKQIAKMQLPVLNEYASKTAGDPKLREFHINYIGWAKEMSYLAD